MRVSSDNPGSQQQMGERPIRESRRAERRGSDRKELAAAMKRVTKEGKCNPTKRKRTRRDKAGMPSVHAAWADSLETRTQDAGRRALSPRGRRGHSWRQYTSLIKFVAYAARARRKRKNFAVDAPVTDYMEHQPWYMTPVRRRFERL